MGEKNESELQEMFVKGNERFAKFMGMSKGHPDPNETRWKNRWFESLVVDGNEFESGRNHEVLLFNVSWDWLKPVIDKIIGLIGVKTVDECTDEEWRYYTMISRMWIGVDIVQAWTYVEDFICFYYSSRCSLNKD